MADYLKCDISDLCLEICDNGGDKALQQLQAQENDIEILWSDTGRVENAGNGEMKGAMILEMIRKPSSVPYIKFFNGLYCIVQNVRNL